VRVLHAGEHEQGAQERGGAGGIAAQLGQDAPVLQVGEAVLVERPAAMRWWTILWVSVNFVLRFFWCR
jgi:hypothetical protein